MLICLNTKLEQKLTNITKNTGILARHELMPNTKFQQYKVFVRNDLVENKTKSCRKWSKKFLIQKKLGLDPDVVTYDNQDIIKSLHNKFEGEIIITQYSLKSSHVALTGPTRQQVLQLD